MSCHLPSANSFSKRGREEHSKGTILLQSCEVKSTHRYNSDNEGRNGCSSRLHSKGKHPSCVAASTTGTQKPLQNPKDPQSSSTIYAAITIVVVYRNSATARRNLGQCRPLRVIRLFPTNSHDNLANTSSQLNMLFYYIRSALVIVPLLCVEQSHSSWPSTLTKLRGCGIAIFDICSQTLNYAGAFLA